MVGQPCIPEFEIRDACFGGPWARAIQNKFGRYPGSFMGAPQQCFAFKVQNHRDVPPREVTDMSLLVADCLSAAVLKVIGIAHGHLPVPEGGVRPKSPEEMVTLLTEVYKGINYDFIPSERGPFQLAVPFRPDLIHLNTEALFVELTKLEINPAVFEAPFFTMTWFATKERQHPDPNESNVLLSLLQNELRLYAAGSEELDSEVVDAIAAYFVPGHWASLSSILVQQRPSKEQVTAALARALKQLQDYDGE
eukprot:TRINITY_DN27580_c0_g1_i3.p1 TRINITY_DN27580_c0_g1~~TRINITY_DN27580_c0_g1_i3.p1  ORF type:complete len:251 (-),score=34.09 TRINITY_DN27580_c0_g1_i3:718-1470(-)